VKRTINLPKETEMFIRGQPNSEENLDELDKCSLWFLRAFPFPVEFSSDRWRHINFQRSSLCYYPVVLPLYYTSLLTFIFYASQHLGCYLEGQGHSMTLQQNRVLPITLLFEVGCYNYFWQTTSLCPIPFRGALPGSTGSCLKDHSVEF